MIADMYKKMGGDEYYGQIRNEFTRQGWTEHWTCCLMSSCAIHPSRFQAKHGCTEGYIASSPSGLSYLQNTNFWRKWGNMK